MQRGFTLVELAIVLVIIGLLVGGVLVGTDLIRSAAINATVSDVQSYQAAAVTFRDKFGGIPGDLRNDKAQQFGLTVSATSPGTYGEGDGDGMLQNGSTGTVTGKMQLGGENTLFWRHLSDAKLIPFTSTADGTTIDTTNFGTGATTDTVLSPMLPSLRLRRGGFIHAFGRNGGNYFVLADFDTAGGGVGGTLNMDKLILSPREAMGIDQKMDDGYPATGIMISTGTTLNSLFPKNGGSPVTSADTLCYDNTTTAGAYATSTDSFASSFRCALMLKAGF